MHTPYEAVYIENGYVVELSTNFVPPGVFECGFACNDNFCYYGTNISAPSPQGPMEYRSYAYTPSASSCKWQSGAVCGNGGTDNFFWNRTN